MTCHSYCDIVDYVKIPYILEDPFPDTNFVLQHDLCPVHTSHEVRNLLEGR